MNYCVVELAAALTLTGWVYLVIKSISYRYYRMAVRDLGDEGLARYSTRKVVHILGGGVPAALTLVTFRDPLIPFVLSMLVASYALVRRRFGPLSWFQEPNNVNEVTFSVMWGASLIISWVLNDGMLFGVLAALFLSIGDGVTGIVRSLVVGRGKSVEGTLAMMAVCSALGLLMAGAAGVVSGIVSSLVERIKAIDDNILIPLAAIAVLEAAKLMAPWSLMPLQYLV